MRRFALAAAAGSALALCSSLALAGGLLVVAPHPDDDLLIASGLIANAKARGDQVKVVFMTNGDFTGEMIGGVRQGEAVNAQTLHLGTLETDLIFLGYPDGGLQNIYANHPDITDAYTGPNNRSTTYGSRGLGMADYHTHQFGVPALYNRANIAIDLQSIIATFQPDHIVTTSGYDMHPDHAITFQLVKQAINDTIAAVPGYNPALHQGIVWSDYIYEIPRWPAPIDPTGYHTTLPEIFDVTLPWAARESIEVPQAMQSPDLLANPKYLAIDSHTSQGGGPSFLGRFVHKDEIFWSETLAGATLPPRAVASGTKVSSGATGALSSSGSMDPGGAPLTYAWRQAGGPFSLLIGASTANPTFQAPAALFEDEVVSFELVVGNGTKHSLPNLVSIPVLISTTNIAPLATASASSENSGDAQTAQKAIDGVVDGWPGDFAREWSTVGQGAGAWLQLHWSSPVTVTRVHLFDRPNSNDRVTSGTLTFSDGSHVAVQALQNDGGLTDVTFTPRTVSWLRFTVDTTSPETDNIGLAEIEVLGLSANQAPRANAGPARSVVGGTTVQLDGSTSRDLEQDALTWQWQQTSGPTVLLSSTTTARPTFVAPAGPATLGFELVVADGQQSSAPATTTLTVLSAQDNNSNTLADAWESLYGVSDPNADPDHDGLTNLQEHNLGSHPTDAAPTVVINTPAAGATYAAGAPIQFAGTASDPEDGPLSGAIQWSSDLAGPLGTGASLYKVLAVGTHTITATVVDSKGASPVAVATRQIHVSAIVRNGDIDGNGTVDVADVLRLQQYLNGARTLTNIEIARGDLYPTSSGDGQLTLSDLLLLEKLLAH
jgi:LmbE family N-acetylglucosaminyl deacetylase